MRQASRCDDVYVMCKRRALQRILAPHSLRSLDGAMLFECLHNVSLLKFTVSQPPKEQQKVFLQLFHLKKFQRELIGDQRSYTVTGALPH
jgi:hypothetical protein